MPGYLEDMMYQIRDHCGTQVVGLAHDFYDQRAHRLTDTVHYILRQGEGKSATKRLHVKTNRGYAAYGGWNIINPSGRIRGVVEEMLIHEPNVELHVSGVHLADRFTYSATQELVLRSRTKEALRDGRLQQTQQAVFPRYVCSGVPGRLVDGREVIGGLRALINDFVFQ